MLAIIILFLRVGILLRKKIRFGYKIRISTQSDDPYFKLWSIEINNYKGTVI